MKISAKYFYSTHLDELSKIVNHDTKYINIINEKSSFPRKDQENILEISEFETISNKLSSVTDELFEVIILTDLFELSDDLYNTLKNLRKYLTDDGIIALSSINPLWYKIINFVELFGLKKKTKIKSYIKPKNIESVLSAANYIYVNSYNRLVFPFRLFGIGVLINYLFSLSLPFLHIGIRNYLIYKKASDNSVKYSKTILVPAKNEEGNLEDVITRIPSFKEKCEIIIICGESKDNTFGVANELKEKYTEKNIKVLKQTKNGKANAIWEGLKVSKNSIIAVLDSDLSVDPETLIDFFGIIEKTNADFVNGTRLIYKMENGAMRTLNKVGNRFFQYIISKLISVELTDSLCGTKVFKRKNINYLYGWQNKMSVKDPFCDFDLIFSSAYASKKIVELPVHYKSRSYGTTNISRFKDGWRLIFYLLNSYFLFKTNYYPKKLYQE
jgi:hypothetical protein